MRLYDALNEQDFSEVKKMFTEYAESLNFNLCFQGFEEEIQTLPSKYSSPDGFILLAEHENKIAGCIALRKLENDICEMKRLFVKPEFRGLGIGKMLCEELISRAKQIGYSKMRLDTIREQMKEAIKLYKSFGFYEIKSYYYNPQESVLYMELIL